LRCRNSAFDKTNKNKQKTTLNKQGKPIGCGNSASNKILKFTALAELRCRNSAFGK